MQALARRLARAKRPRPDRPIRVTLAITDLDVGGAERALVALARGLDRARWTPSVVCLGPPGALEAPLVASGIAVDCLGADRRRPVALIAKLARSLRGSRPEIIQSFLFHANVAARLASPFAGRPWVVGGLRVAEREKGWHLAIDRITQRLAAGSACVSEGVRRFSTEAGRLAGDRLVVIPNGVDPAPFDRAEPAAIEFATGGPVALFVGRIEPQKGVADLLEAAGRVAGLRMLLVGDGPDRVRLEESTRRLDALAGRVRWLGRRDDVPSLLKAADLLVLPSLWEGMPNVVLEAMAARRAVVATAVEGSEDLVVPGETGWLVPPSRPDLLADALADAISDPARLRRFGEAGRAIVEARFTPSRVVEAYDRLWSGLLGYADPIAPASVRSAGAG